MLHWLSFADPKRPEGTQFLGVVIVESPVFIMAVTKTHALGVNPGGECQGFELLDYRVPPEMMDRLLNKTELSWLERYNGYDGELLTIAAAEERGLLSEPEGPTES